MNPVEELVFELAFDLGSEIVDPYGDIHPPLLMLDLEYERAQEQIAFDFLEMLDQD